MSGAAGRVLELTEVSVARGGKRLVEGVSFSLDGGRYLELQGQNGSGKTSLLRVLAMLQDAGAVPAGSISQPEPHASFYYGHQSGFRSELEVAEQLALSLRMYGHDPDTAAVKALLQKVGLLHQAQAKVRQLSQGQTRRLMLALMLGSERTLWLIDEPLNALDVQAIGLFKQILVEHFQRGGAAVVATHRALEDAMPGIALYSAGALKIDGGRATYFAEAANDAGPAPLRADAPAVRGWPALVWVMRREFALTAARPQDMLWPSIFHWMVVTLFPFGLGTEQELLARAAGGVFWVSALLATLIGATRFFDADFEHGALNEVCTARVPLAIFALGKIVSGWVFMGLPLALCSLPLGLLYGLNGPVLLVLFASLALGSVSLSAFSALFAALGLMARQAQVVICLLALPAFVPLLVFGTAAVTGAQSGLGSGSPLLVLATVACLTLVGLPVVCGKVLALAVE